MSDDGVLSTKKGANRYELIIATAREARRLNDYYRTRNIEPKSRITTEAIKRALGEGIPFTYSGPRVDADEPGEDTPS